VASPNIHVIGNDLIDHLALVKYVPQWFPGAGFQRYAAQVKTLHRVMRDRPVEVTQAQMVRHHSSLMNNMPMSEAGQSMVYQATGMAPVSIVQQMLDGTKSSGPENVELIKDVAGIVYLAGLDTTVAAVVSFFLAMVIYPDVQLRAQAELDSVVGRGRLPEFSDKKDLPYVNAVMSECLRWIPVVPMGSSIYIVLRTKKCRD
jgi:hypothetical protein